MTYHVELPSSVFTITPKIAENIKRVVEDRNKAQAERELVDKDMKHSHYFKDVSKLKTIDVYRVLQLFEVADPCIQHAVKKLLVAGGRGAKDKHKDIQEAIDTLRRWQVMRNEDFRQMYSKQTEIVLHNLIVSEHRDAEKLSTRRR